MKLIYIALFLSGTLVVAKSQNETDALNFSLDRPTGTARSMSLGGAMGALGGDYTSISINPAGIAVYRGSEFSFTPSLVYSRTESDYYGTLANDDRFSVPIQQIGFVGTYRPMREVSTGLISTHFSIGYTRTNSFSRNTFIQGQGIQSSLLDEFVHRSELQTPQTLNNFYQGIAYDVELMDLLPGALDAYFHGWEYLNQTAPGEFSIEWGPLHGINQGKIISERGNTGEINIAGGANLSNKFYFGGSLGITTLNYSKKSQHFEEVNFGARATFSQGYINFRDSEGYRHLDSFTFDDNFTASGTGVNLKVGVIFKPVNALRIGAAVHTPDFYSIDLNYDTDVKATFMDGTSIMPESTPTGEFSYNFRTPMKFIGSLAYVFGDKGLISIDYQRVDYSAMKYKSKGNSVREMNEMDILNNTIANTFRATNNLRFGIEYRATQALSLRGGYAVLQNPFTNQFLNSKDTHRTFSGGIGYRMESMFVDFAYLLRRENYIHSLYYSPAVTAEYQNPANVTNNTHQFAITLGWRF